MAAPDPTASAPPIKVFITYRRDDTRGYAGRLHESLTARLGRGQVFIDIDGIRPGVDFVDVLTDTLDRADVVLALVGPAWVGATGHDGSRRLDDPSDFVRLELEAALTRGARIVPLLVGGARMPNPDQVPPSLAPFCRRNALEISDDRWRFDVGRLLDVIEGSPVRQEEPVAAGGPDVSSLPTFLSRFIGRSIELAALRALIPKHRLLTITGPGGVGKTRLAVQAANAAVDGFPDGVGFIDLSAVRDPALVPTAMAEALSIDIAPGRSAEELIVEALAARRQLLVLDNLEQVAEAATFVAMLLRRTRTLHLVATSRVPLWVRGEHEYALEPLPLPARTDDQEALADNDAIRLFIDEAGRHGATVLSNDNAGAIAEICRRLDGLPLAIELVAAQTRSIPISALAQRMEHRLDVPAPQVDLPDRQRTLRATITWSVGLLSPSAARLFSQVAVFAGGFPLEAAEAMSETARGAPDAAGRVEAQHANRADGLDDLVRHSLVRLAPGGSGRYSMLETIRELALGQLADGGQLDATRDAQIAWLTTVLERSETAFARAEDQAAAIDASDAERANVRDALAWAAANGREEAALRLAGARHFWAMRGSAVEGRRWLEDLLGRPMPYHDRTIAQARTVLGSLVLWMGDRETAQEHLEAARGLWQRLGEQRKLAVVENNLGIVAERMDDFERSRRHGERALALMRELDDAPGIGATLGNLGVLAARQNDFDAADRWHLEALAHARRIGDLETASIALTNLGAGAIQRGRVEEARRWTGEALELCRELDDLEGTIVAIETFGQIALRTDDPALHVRLFAGAQRLRDEYQAARLASEQPEVAAMLSQAREQLHDEGYEAARAEGIAMTLDDLVAAARAVAAGGSSAAPPRVPAG